MIGPVVTRSRNVRALVAACALVLVACSQHQDLMGPGNGGEVVEIQIRNFEFADPEVHIAPGTTVRWRNTTGNFHTVTPDGHTAWNEWQTAGEGETFEVRFEVAGTYPYYCQPHRPLGMMGTIVVE